MKKAKHSNLAEAFHQKHKKKSKSKAKTEKGKMLKAQLYSMAMSRAANDF